MGYTAKIYLENNNDLLAKVSDALKTYNDISFYDFTAFSEVPNLMISSDISEFILDIGEEPSYWLTNPINFEDIKQIGASYLANNMSHAIHPEVLLTLTNLLEKGESIYFIYHHERGDNNYDDLMMEITNTHWDCHLRGYEGETMEHRIFDIANNTSELIGDFNWEFIDEALKINFS